MLSLPNSAHAIADFSAPSYQMLMQEKLRQKWDDLGMCTVKQMVDEWLTFLKPITSGTYGKLFRYMYEKGFVNPNHTLQQFSVIDHNLVVDSIKRWPGLAEDTKQTRAACYISFTRHLSRKVPEYIRAAQPCKEGENKTFPRVREKTVYQALTPEEWIYLHSAIEERSPRDALIAQMLLQGGKRISEVLIAKIENIDWEENTIIFEQSKTRYIEAYTIIHFPLTYMLKLKKYLGSRDSGLIFVTRNGKPVLDTHVKRTFRQVALDCDFKKQISPHTLRTTAVTWMKEKGFQDSDIVKVTGHTNFDVKYYDKTSPKNNPTKVMNLI
jgi:integrase/recombinase XerD